MTEKAPDFLKARSLRTGMVRHIVTVQPATGFEYRYESSSGTARVIHLERGAHESRGGQPAELLAFGLGFPQEKTRRGVASSLRRTRST